MMRILILMTVLLFPSWVFANCEVMPTTTFKMGSFLAADVCDTAGNKRVGLGVLLEGEDVDAHVMKVEQQMFGKGNLTADTLISGLPSFVHTITCQGTDAAATAGTIILYNNTVESGTQLWHWDVQAVAIPQPFTVTLDMKATTGLYLGYTTTTDVNCAVSYRE